MSLVVILVGGYLLVMAVVLLFVMGLGRMAKDAEEHEVKRRRRAARRRAGRADGSPPPARRRPRLVRAPRVSRPSAAKSKARDSIR